MAILTQLPFDIERELPTNQIKNEKHTVTTAVGKTNRVIVPDFGAFFVDGVDVRDARGVKVERYKGLELTYHYELFSEAAGTGVAAMMVITDQTRPSPFTINYHAVGGSFSLSVKELLGVFDGSTGTGEEIKWDDILDKPDTYPVAPHFNKWWQLYGLDSPVTNLIRLGDAWAVGRKATLDANRTYYRLFTGEMQAALDAYTAAILNHVTDRSNPHNTDKNGIGLGNLNNWPLANLVQAADLTIQDIYQPIGGVYRQLMTTVIPELDGHIRDRATLTNPDPHYVTLAQLGLYSKTEIDNIFSKHLAKSQPAYDTKLIVGLNWAQVSDIIRNNLDAASIDLTTKFTTAQIGVGLVAENINDQVLMGNNSFYSFANLMKSFNDKSGNIVSVGPHPTVAAAKAKAETLDLKPGAWIIGSYSRAYHYATLYAPCVMLRNEANETVVMAQ